MGFTNLNILKEDSNKISAKKRDGRLKQNEYEIQHIRDSIDLFYMPLLNLLTIYNENVTCKAKERIINEINGHKHLVEPVESGVRPLLEIYLKTNAEFKKIVSEDLLKLVYRDLESLQNRFIELRNEQITKTED